MEIGGNVNIHNRGFHNDVPVHLKLLLTLWWLGNKESFRQIGDRFFIQKGTLGVHMTISIRQNKAHFIYPLNYMQDLSTT